MSSQNYRHPKWQMKRLEILKRDGAKCQFCGDSESELHVHHMVYPRGKKPWEISDQYLITLCEDCHRHAEGMRDNFSILFCGDSPVRDCLQNLLLTVNENLDFPSEIIDSFNAVSSCPISRAAAIAVSNQIALEKSTREAFLLKK